MSETDWERLQRMKAEGLAPGQRLGRDVEEPRQETKRDKRESREDPTPDRASERQRLRDLGREKRENEARANQENLVKARRAGLSRKLPDVPRPNDGFDSVFLNAKPNLAEGPSLIPPVKPAERLGREYQPTVIPNSDQKPIPRTLGQTEEEDERRWSLYVEDSDYYCRLGKVWLGSEGTEKSITSGNAALTLAFPGAVWLEADTANVTTLTLDAGAMPSDLYEAANGTMTAYRKILGDTANATMGTGSIMLGNGVWYRPRVADADLLAVSTVVAIDGNATLAVELQSC